MLELRSGLEMSLQMTGDLKFLTVVNLHRAYDVTYATG